MIETYVMGKGDMATLQRRQNERDGVSDHQLNDCSKLRVAGLCEGNSLMIGEFPAQMASNAETVFIWWRHNEDLGSSCVFFCQMNNAPDSFFSAKWILHRTVFTREDIIWSVLDRTVTLTFHSFFTNGICELVWSDKNVSGCIFRT